MPQCYYRRIKLGKQHLLLGNVLLCTVHCWWSGWHARLTQEVDIQENNNCVRYLSAKIYLHLKMNYRKTWNYRRFLSYRSSVGWSAFDLETRARHVRGRGRFVLMVRFREKSRSHERLRDPTRRFPAAARSHRIGLCCLGPAAIDAAQQVGPRWPDSPLGVAAWDFAWRL